MQLYICVYFALSRPPFIFATCLYWTVGNGSILGDFGNFSSAPLQPSSSIPPTVTPSQAAFADFSSFQSTAPSSQSLLQPTRVCMYARLHLPILCYSSPAPLVAHELAKEVMFAFRPFLYIYTSFQSIFVHVVLDHLCAGSFKCKI